MLPQGLLRGLVSIDIVRLAFRVPVLFFPERCAVFLLFQEPQPAPLIIPAGAPEYGVELKDRMCWNAMEFGDKYSLKLVGVNFFQAKSMER